jgi:hypothetical protein
LNKKAYEIYKSPSTGKTHVNLTQVSSVSPAKEPAIAAGTTVFTLTGLLSGITVLFPHLLTDRQTAAAFLIAALISPFVTALLTRRKVWSPASVLELVEEAIKEAEKLPSVANKPVNKDVPPKVL